MPSIDVNVHVTFSALTVTHVSAPDPRLDLIQAQLATVISNQEQLLMTEQEVLDQLTLVDTATNALAANVTAIGTTTKSIADAGSTIKSELEALLASVNTNPSVPKSVSDALASLVAKTTPLVAAAQSATDALAAQVPVLQGIASEGASNPVPVQPPPPPPPPPGA